MQGETLGSQDVDLPVRVSIHSPYAGRDEATAKDPEPGAKFQSTLPMQGETQRDGERAASQPGFNPLSLCRERQRRAKRARRHAVSIHSPYAGRDMYRPLLTKGERVSIHSPYAGRDDLERVRRLRRLVSIHSPYAGRDSRKNAHLLKRCGFNPLSLCRERPMTADMIEVWMEFQSTLPMQGETQDPAPKEAKAESFNPLSLCRERPEHDRLLCVWLAVSIHSPYAGRDALNSYARRIADVSIHSPYAGRDAGLFTSTPNRLFQSTLPMQGETSAVRGQP